VHDELASLLEEQTAAGQVAIGADSDGLAIDIVAELLFTADGAVLSEAGEELLHMIGQVLQRYELQELVAQGYTGADGIAGQPAGEYPDSLQLSAARVAAVACFLQELVKLDPARLAAIAHAEYHPGEDVEDVSAAERRGSVGRIELVLAPPPEPDEGDQDSSTSEQSTES
jgi:flagellar motor protein MotB